MPVAAELLRRHMESFFLGHERPRKTIANRNRAEAFLRATQSLSSRAECVGEQSEPTHAVEGPCVFPTAQGKLADDFDDGLRGPPPYLKMTEVVRSKPGSYRQRTRVPRGRASQKSAAVRATSVHASDAPALERKKM